MDEDGTTFRYTANQRRKDLKTKKYKKITENLKNNFKIEDQSICEIENGLAEISYKTTHFELFKIYLRRKIEISNKIWDFYEKENLRKLRWFKFINEQKSKQHMINMRNMGKLQKEKVLESCLKNIIMMYF